MFNSEAAAVLLEKVPDLKRPVGILLTVLYTLALCGVCVVFFYAVDRMGPAAALVSQTIMALIVVLISYLHFVLAPRYRQRYGEMAYRYYFYHFMLPYLVTWYAVFFHPLFVGGSVLLPTGVALVLGVLGVALMVLASLQIERAGFHMETHGMDLYTVFPEETTVVHGVIYGYIRHPLCFALLVGSLGLAFFRNTDLALLVSMIQIIPVVFSAVMEDRELIERAGDEHRAYVARTPMLVPLRRLPGFVRLLITGRD